METIQIWIDTTEPGRPYIVSRGANGEDAPDTVAVCDTHAEAMATARALSAETGMSIEDETGEPIKAAQSASGRATAEKLGPAGRTERAKAGAAARWEPKILICTSIEAIALQVDHDDERVRREAADDVRERLYDIAQDALIAAKSKATLSAMDYREWTGQQGATFGLVRYWPQTEAVERVAEVVDAAIAAELAAAVKRAE